MNDRKQAFGSLCSQLRSALRDQALPVSTVTEVDAANIEQLSRFHRVDRLIQTFDKNVVSHVSTDKDAKRKSVLQTMQRSAQIVQCCRMFEDKKIRNILLKGEAISLRYYPRPEARHAKDIDIWVPLGDVLKTVDLLKEMGFEQVYPSFSFDGNLFPIVELLTKNVEFFHPRTGVNLELHWRLFGNRHVFPVNFERCYGRAETVWLAEMEVKVLNKSDQFAYLCCHGAAHRWFRLKWLTDIYCMMNHLEGDDIDNISRVAHELGVLNNVVVAQALCKKLFENEEPDNLSIKRQVEKFEAVLLSMNVPQKRSLLDLGKVVREKIELHREGKGWRFNVHQTLLGLVRTEDVGLLGLGKKWLPLYLVFAPLRRLLKSILRR